MFKKWDVNFLLVFSLSMEAVQSSVSWSPNKNVYAKVTRNCRWPETVEFTVPVYEKTFKISCSKCNSLSIMKGVETEITKSYTVVDEFWFAKSIQITLFLGLNKPLNNRWRNCYQNNLYLYIQWFHLIRQKCTVFFFTETVVIPNGICIVSLGSIHERFLLKFFSLYAYARIPFIKFWNRNLDTDVRVYVYIAFKVCSCFNTNGCNLKLLLKFVTLSINYISLTAVFISKWCDFIDWDILKIIFCTLFLTLVLIIKRQFGLDRHS